MRSLFLTVAVLAGAVACGAPSRQDAAAIDPKAPANDAAVISVPSNLPTLDSSSAKSPSHSLIPSDAIKRSTAVNSLYSLISATMVNQDGRMLGQLYMPSAVLRVPDSTVTGGPEVVRYLLNLARSKSLADFQRTSHGVRIGDDSTLVDSGSYVMVLKRSAKDSVVERGQYTSTVRARADVSAWMILDDRLRPRSSPKPKGAK